MICGISDDEEDEVVVTRRYRLLDNIFLFYRLTDLFSVLWPYFSIWHGFSMTTFSLSPLHRSSSLGPLPPRPVFLKTYYPDWGKWGGGGEREKCTQISRIEGRSRCWASFTMPYGIMCGVINEGECSDVPYRCIHVWGGDERWVRVKCVCDGGLGVVLCGTRRERGER